MKQTNLNAIAQLAVALALLLFAVHEWILLRDPSRDSRVTYYSIEFAKLLNIMS